MFQVSHDDGVEKKSKCEAAGRVGQGPARECAWGFPTYVQYSSSHNQQTLKKGGFRQQTSHC